MNSIKQVIVNAVYKVSVDPQYANKEYPTPEDARADFIKSLIAELFPDNPSVPESTYVGPGAEPKVEKKKRAPKAKKETEEVKIEVPVVAEVKTEEVVAEAKTEEPKKKRAPKAKKVEAVTEVVAEVKPEVVAEVKAEAKAEVVAEAKPEEPKEKKKRAPKAKPEGAPKNIEKINPTQTKKLKENEVDKKVFLDHLNSLTTEEFNSKTFEEHILAFKNPPVVPAKQEVECFVVDYKGKEYYVDPKSKKVYNDADEYVGDVGMLEFKDMVIPSDE